MLERVAVVVVMSMVAAGCGGGEDRCASTVAKIMGGAPKGDGFAQLSAEEQGKRLALRDQARAAVTASCRKESWSKAFFDCIAASDGSKRGDRACEELMTPAQQAAAKAALEAVMAPADQDRAGDAAAEPVPVPAAPRPDDAADADRAKLEAARKAAESATSEAERAAAAAEIQAIEARLRRRAAINVRPECVENPLAKGC